MDAAAGLGGALDSVPSLGDAAAAGAGGLGVAGGVGLNTGLTDARGAAPALVAGSEWRGGAGRAPDGGGEDEEVAALDGAGGGAATGEGVRTKVLAAVDLAVAAEGGAGRLTGGGGGSS